MQSRQIKSRLRKKNLLQKDLAKRLNVSPTSMTRFIAGEFTSARLERGLARALGISVSAFRGEERQV